MAVNSQAAGVGGGGFGLGGGVLGEGVVDGFGGLRGKVVGGVGVED